MTTSRSATTVWLRHSAFAIAGTAFAAVLACSSPASADDTPANLLPNYTVTSSFSGRSRHTGGNNVGVLFDNATSTYIGFNQSSATLYINFTLNEAVAANAYGVACGPSAYYSAVGRAPRAFSLAAYDETAEEWIELDSRSGVSSWTLEEIKVFHFANTTAYAKWRLAITQGTGYVGLSEIQLYNVDNSGVLDVESNAGEYAVPSPAYGSGHRFTTGSTVTCTISGADAVFDDGQGGRFVFDGYDLYTNVDLNPILAMSGSASSVTYVQESHSRLVWKWTLAPLHVATNGNDENDGFSWETAKATLAGAVSAASVSGQQIFIGDGAYPVAAAISITKDVRVAAAEGASPSSSAEARTGSLRSTMRRPSSRDLSSPTATPRAGRVSPRHPAFSSRPARSGTASSPAVSARTTAAPRSSSTAPTPSPRGASSRTTPPTTPTQTSAPTFCTAVVRRSSRDALKRASSQAIRAAAPQASTRQAERWRTASSPATSARASGRTSPPQWAAQRRRPGERSSSRAER